MLTYIIPRTHLHARNETVFNIYQLTRIDKEATKIENKQDAASSSTVNKKITELSATDMSQKRTRTLSSMYIGLMFR